MKKEMLEAFMCKKCINMNYCDCKCTRCQNTSVYSWWNKLTTCGRCFGREKELQTCAGCKGKKVTDLCSKCKSYLRDSASRWPNGKLPSGIVDTDPQFYIDDKHLGVLQSQGPQKKKDNR